MPPTNNKRVIRRPKPTVLLLALALIAAPALVLTGTTTATAARSQAWEAPNVRYPVAGSVTDRRNYGPRYLGTDLASPCGTKVVAAHPGIANVHPGLPWAGKYLVTIVTSPGQLETWYGYLDTVTVKTGQIIQSAQMIGTVGKRAAGKPCGLFFSVRSKSGHSSVNPSSWLAKYTNAPPPISSLFGNTGFTIASFNVLGASHTPAGSGWMSGTQRMGKQVTMLNTMGADVVGLQEFQGPQRTEFLRLTGSAWGTYPTSGDIENSIIWRASKFTFVSGQTMDIPYFKGSIRKMPVVKLRERATGRTAWFMNVHNPASVAPWGDSSQWRAEALKREREKMIALRAEGRPVFLTGDFNDWEKAICAITPGKLAISPNSVPSVPCWLPRTIWIDWIFAAGQVRFSWWRRDMFPVDTKISDHPIIISRAHMAS